MRKFQYDFFHPLWIDNFCGGGGASLGIELATGRTVDIAINHDPAAIAMHRANHPFTHHYCESVWDVDPAKATQGRPVALTWFSPDCKHFSKAAGGKPREKKIRGLSWIVLRWALDVRPQCMMMENVEEIKTWGPLIQDKNGRWIPDPARAGETFQGFIAMLTTGISPDHPAFAEACEFLQLSHESYQAQQLIKGLGFVVEHKELVAANFGAPTIRKRFFLIARSDGKPIVWPKPTHAKNGAGGLKPWRSAAEIIDWSLPCPSIFASKQEIKAQYGLKAKRPLEAATLRRVALGTDKFVIKEQHPYIVDSNHTPMKGAYDFFRGANIDDSLHSITGKHWHGFETPFVTKFQQNSIGTSLNEPMDTVMAGATRFGVIAPVITAIGQTGFSADRSRSIDSPIHTTVSKAEKCLLAPSLIQYHAEQSNHVRGQKVDAPLLTIDAANRYAIAVPSFMKYYGQGIGHPAGDPLHTITAKDREALTMAYISKYYAGGYDGAGSTAHDPLPTVTAVDHNAVTAAHLVTFRNNMDGQYAADPLYTISAAGQHHGLVKAHLVKVSEGVQLYHWPEVRALLNEYCGYTMANDDVLLLEINGVLWFIADIGLRMLTPRELYNANGAPPDYIIDTDADGKPYPKYEQVARCGNMVPPPFAEALVRANFPDLAAKHKFSTMEALLDHMAI